MTYKSGTFADADLAAGIVAKLYTVPDATVCTAEVGFSNRTATPVKIRIAIGTGADPVNANYREYDWTVPANSPFIRTFPLAAGENVWVRSDIAGVSAYIAGFEEAA